MVPALTTVLPFSTKSSKIVRPRTLSDKGSIISSPSFKSSAKIPLIVPQSNSEITTSWATSTNRRVRYPASAVFNAVSANPFRAPCVEIKYSCTERPSLKFEVMGDSIISPFPPVMDFLGFAIKPRIPANCLI